MAKSAIVELWWVCNCSQLSIKLHLGDIADINMHKLKIILR